MLVIVASRRQRSQAIEASDAKHMNHGVRAAADHDVCVASLQDVACLTDGLRARRAGRQAVEGRPAQAELAGDVRDGFVGLLGNFITARDVLFGRLEPSSVVDVFACPGRETRLLIRVKVQHALAGSQIEPAPPKKTPAPQSLN